MAEAEPDRHAPPGVFRAWTPETFARAKRERRIVVLMVSTTWCHWCHVMKRETYGDPAVRAALARHFQPVLVDADERPDLAERFRNYRWPTTAFLTPDAEPILALRGYRNPKAFLGILADVRRRVARGGPHPGFDEPAKPTGARFEGEAGLVRMRDRLRAELVEHYDPKRAGWGTRQKYPVPEPVEYGLWRRLTDGKPSPAYERSIATLAATEALIDRAWGGVYQYSVGATWDRWHPEKIMSVNAGALTTYAVAHRITGETRWLRNARDVVRWFERFMTASDGRFYGTQDADAPRMKGEALYRLGAKERARHGIPRVNPRVYTKDNGEAALGLLALHAATGDVKPLAMARRALEQVRAKAVRADGIVVHEAERPNAPLFLADHAVLGRAFLAMHQASAPVDGAVWLAAAKRVARAMNQRFLDRAQGGYFDVAGDPVTNGVFGRRIKSFEPNAVAARFLLELFAITEDPAYEREATRAITAVGRVNAIDAHWRYSAGLLIAVEQRLAPWVRIEIVGDPKRPAYAALVKRARALARAHPGVYWTARAEGADAQPAALVCGRGTCSDPVEDALTLALVVDRVLAR
ncbi:MAG: DUF255 domain-containing protein [Planctomycetota bacterium]|nr:DUF255 domain-containing protein [Planctomycetota bacterium]